MGRALLWVLVVFCGWKSYDHFIGQPRSVDAAIKRVAHDQLIMYSLTTCGFCNQKRKELNAAGIPFTEFFLDKDRDIQQLLHIRMESQGVSTAYYGTPTFDVGGRIVTGNPGLDEIIKLLPPGMKRI